MASFCDMLEELFLLAYTTMVLYVWLYHCQKTWFSMLPPGHSIPMTMSGCMGT